MKCPQSLHTYEEISMKKKGPSEGQQTVGLVTVSVLHFLIVNKFC